MRKEEKLKSVVQKTKQLERSLKKASKEKRSSHQGTTSADLRAMRDVVAKVDKLMDDKKLNFKETSSEHSSDSDTDSTSSLSSSGPNSSCSDSEKERRRRRKKKKDKKRDEKRKSGKEKRLTSYVKFPEKWPHSHLKLHFVSKEKKYDDLSISEFCAGYMSILKICKSSHKEPRIAHLEELMYHATTKPWKCVLNYHAACLLEIERGNLKWGDNFQLHGLQSTTLHNSGSISNSCGKAGAANQSGNSQSSGSDERVWFCKSFQRGLCTFSRDHYGQLNGENQLLKHICAKCWLTIKKQSPHPEQSDTCPLFGIEL